MVGKEEKPRYPARGSYGHPLHPDLLPTASAFGAHQASPGTLTYSCGPNGQQQTNAGPKRNTVHCAKQPASPGDASGAGRQAYGRARPR